MKRIALSLTVIIAVAAMVSGATYAVFSDQDSFVGNTISTATVNIDAREEGSQTELQKPVSAEGLVPGQFTQWYRGIVFNQGTVPVRVFMHVENVTGDACDFTNLEVLTGHASNGGEDEREREVFALGPLNNLEGEGKRVELTGTPPFDELGPNISQVLQQRAQLDEEADNNVMGQSCTWDEVFTAESIAPDEEANNQDN